MSGLTLNPNDIVGPRSRSNNASTKRVLAEHRAKAEPRYYLKHGDQYLHWSGAKLTGNRDHAYVGSERQVKAIRRSIALAAECRAVECR